MTIRDFLSFKKEHILRKIGEVGYVIPLHKTPQNVKILNSTSLVFWDVLTREDDLESASFKISEYFGINHSTAYEDLNYFLNGFELRLNTEDEVESEINSIILEDVPFKGSFEITGRCNLNCFHCYAISERQNTDLTFSQIKKIVDDLVANNCLFLLLTGGEVLSRPDFNEIYTYIRSKGIIPSINTNLTLLTDAHISLFKKLPPLKIKVSLYGHESDFHDKVTRVIGSFDKVVKNVNLLKKAGINVIFSCLIFKENSKYESLIVKLAANLKVPVAFSRGLVPSLSGNTDFMCYADENMKLDISKQNDLYDSDGVFDCGAGRTTFHMDSLGNLMLCMMEREDKFSVLDSGFREAWKKLKMVRKTRLLRPACCNTCSYQSSCNACPVLYNRFKQSGVLNVYCQYENSSQNRIKT